MNRTINGPGYSFTLPEGHEAEVVSLLPEGGARDRIARALETSGPVRLPETLADALLDAVARWERAREEEAS